ncbi:MAG: YfhO family protein, partial [Muribaculaceae bacterium]|nr:YfhO family protein [Muribaculaceae bacterium]
YFGEPEGTNGPVYAGAIIFTLFVLGCLIVRGPVKWALLALTLMSVFLALGRNMMWLTDLFIDYVPMYSRFRTVESILVIAEFTIPLLAILGLQKLLCGKEGIASHRRAIYASFGATALLCAAGWLFPAVYGPAITEGDIQISNMIGYQLMQAGYPGEAVSMFSINNPAIASAVEQLRYSMVKADSLRSLIFIALAFGAVMLCMTRNAKPWMTAAIIGVLVAADLYTVNKRYLNHDSFCTPQISATDPFPLSANDRAILADTAMNFRVMDVPGFYQAAPSYHHKAVGGYHAAKLTRYQDLIDRHLGNFPAGNPTEADMRVLNMLNARYIIGQDGTLHLNDQALGNAWFVDSIAYVDNADSEMNALATLDPASSAVADRRFREILGETAAPTQPGDTIFETSYAPDRLTYSAHSARGGLAVFSEVFFPWGWKCMIDGKEAEIGRVNYLLRAVRIPAGDHTVEMTFRPASVTATVNVARASVTLIYLLVAAALIMALSRPVKPEKQD